MVERHFYSKLEKAAAELGIDIEVIINNACFLSES
jgi:hypothetical protein